MKKKTSRKWIIVFISIFLIALSIGLLQWATFTRAPLPEAVAALKSDQFVMVTQEPWLTFIPINTTPQTGFIFYPGGRIDSRGYASLMRQISEEGYLVIVPEFPFNMAPFASNIAEEVIADHPEIDRWVIGGHSVGGTMAVQFTKRNPDVIGGLAIWASYPADNTDISDLDIPVISIYGSRELRVNDESVADRQYLLPESTRYIRIEGGDHHQFGSYEISPEDHLATISRASQHQQIISATLELLERASSK
jgi:predicted esterase